EERHGCRQGEWHPGHASRHRLCQRHRHILIAAGRHAPGCFRVLRAGSLRHRSIAGPVKLLRQPDRLPDRSHRSDQGMKTLDSGFAAHIAGTVTTLAWCWKITRADAAVQGFTDHDSDLAFDGVIYAAATGFTASQ